MHMGSMAVLASRKPDNMVHIVLNNTRHETVGGMPTVAGNINLVTIAEGQDILMLYVLIISLI